MTHSTQLTKTKTVDVNPMCKILQSPDQTSICDVNYSTVSSQWCLSLVLPLEMLVHLEEMYLAGVS